MVARAATTAPASPLLTAPIGPTIIRLAAPNMIAMVVQGLLTGAAIRLGAWSRGLGRKAAGCRKAAG